MAIQIAIFYLAIFSLLFLSRIIWTWIIARFEIESIVYSLSISFPIISALIAGVQTALHWSDKGIVNAEMISCLITCYFSHYLYRRAKGLKAQIYLVTMDPAEGNVGCLVDSLIIACTATILFVQVVIPTEFFQEVILSAKNP